jgi:hypothetical protein
LDGRQPHGGRANGGVESADLPERRRIGECFDEIADLSIASACAFDDNFLVGLRACWLCYRGSSGNNA